MPIHVTLPAAFIRHTAGKKTFDSAASNLSALLLDIVQSYPALGMQIRDQEGQLRRFINIYVNEEDIRFLGGEDYLFQDGDEVMLIPSIAGGCAQVSLSPLQSNDLLAERLILGGLTTNIHL